MMSRGVHWVAVVLVAALVGACHVASDTVVTHRLTDDVSVSAQIKPDDVKAIKAKGFRTIVNMRPDGEAADQPNFPQMQSATQSVGLAYGYVPVKTGPISRTAVE